MTFSKQAAARRQEMAGKKDIGRKKQRQKGTVHQETGTGAQRDISRDRNIKI